MEVLIRTNMPVGDDDAIDIRKGVPDGYVHFCAPRLEAILQRLGVQYAKARVKRAPGRYYVAKPKYEGFVVASHDKPRVRSAIEKRDAMSQLRHEKALEETTVLTALFALNRRAKRCRDLAQKYYLGDMHGFAGKMREAKEAIYCLKEQSLHHLVAEGMLTGGVYHQFTGGNWAEVLEGGGYCFHRPAPPPEGVDPAQRLESIEAKPKGVTEPLISVAREVIERYLAGREHVEVYRWPRFVFCD